MARRTFRLPPLRHKRIPTELLPIVRWTYEVVGHHMLPTLEQWELIMMTAWAGYRPRIHNLSAYIIDWHYKTFAFITYHVRRGLPLRDRAAELRLLAGLLTANREWRDWEGRDTAEMVGGPEERRFIRECLTNPDGWDEECERTQRLLESTGWVPPSHIDWEPYARR
jgi:hypothetical protein